MDWLIGFFVGLVLGLWVGFMAGVKDCDDKIDIDDIL